MKKNKLSILASALIISAAAILTGCSQQASENTNSIKENIPGNNSPNVTIIMGKVTAVSDQSITIVLSAAPDNIQQKDKSQPQNSAQKSALRVPRRDRELLPKMTDSRILSLRQEVKKPASDKVNPNLSTPTPSAQILQNLQAVKKLLPLPIILKLPKGSLKC